VETLLFGGGGKRNFLPLGAPKNYKAGSLLQLMGGGEFKRRPGVTSVNKVRFIYRGWKKREKRMATPDGYLSIETPS